MKYILTVVLVLTLTPIFSQHKTEGIVTDQSGIPIVGANVYIKNSYTGTTTDTTGYFLLTYPEQQDPVLVITLIGYDRVEVLANKKRFFEIKLTEKTNELNEVRISAGAFEAGEEKRAVMMDAIAINTTAGSNGDIYGALSTFPGAQKQGDTGELIVRGGEASETKTYVDGLLVSSPYSSTMPDLPSRGRFSPMMFNGVMFSTGGYSAEYGQALSSVLELQTPGMFNEDITSISLMNVGVGASHTQNFSQSAISVDANYQNTYPYFAMASHDLNWIETPQSGDAKVFYRHKIGKTGMLKTDALFSYSKSKLNYEQTETTFSNIALKNLNYFAKTSYNTNLSEKLLLQTGVALNRNIDQYKPDSSIINEKLTSLHLKAGLTNYLNSHITLKGGVDAYLYSYNFGYKPNTNSPEIKLDATDGIYGSFLETDLKLSKKIALRMGIRAEVSSLTGETNLAPRVSAAYKISNNGQFSMAFGKFHQQPGYEYLKYTNNVTFEEAQHFLFNYQIQKNDRLFRTELYFKQYNQLITYKTGEVLEYENIDNGGNGYAQGIDIFFKDDKTLKNTTYWLSYSFLKSERLYHDYSQNAVPEFLSPHSFSMVTKYWFNKISTQLGASYNFAAGRSYYNPNNPNFMTDRTPASHDVNLNASYITSLFGYFTVVHLAVNNVLNSEHIYSYNYSKNPNQNGEYSLYPVTNHIRRTIIIGVFISIK